MTETNRKPPQPFVQTFIACQQLYLDKRLDLPICVGPNSLVPTKHFPTHVRLSFLCEFTGCRGTYHPRLVLRGSDDEVVWASNNDFNDFEQQNPLIPHKYLIFDLMVAVPRLGRYQFVLYLNDVEVAQRGMWFGPTEAFRS